MNMHETFKQYCLSFAGCDGGDIGSKENPAVWVCGLEWGGSSNLCDELKATLESDFSGISKGYDSWEQNISYPYNRNTMKLLSAIDGGKVEGYEDFAKQVQPFISGRFGYFKANLFPVAFKNTAPERWTSDFQGLTGFATKADYLDWCREHRSTMMNLWMKEYQPKLIICFGKTYLNDFKNYFSDSNETGIHKELIEERELVWFRNQNGTLVIISPFPGNRWGLVKNTTIQAFGERIAELLKHK